MKFSLNNIVAALGLLGVCATAAAADSSVTMYGRIDTAIESVKTGNDRINGVNNSSSYFGFKGQEHLGNGLKMGFILESAINSDDGSISNTEFFSNRSELNLEGAFGTVRMGRFFNPSYYAVADRTSLHNEDYGITADALYAGVENANNRLAYKSPAMGSLTVESSVSFHERSAGNLGKNAYDMAANYDHGNWSFGAGYGEWAQARQYALRATWSEGGWTVSGYHQRSQDVVAGVTQKANASRIAVAYAVGAGDIQANFGHANGAGPAQAQQWTVGYNHHLSKRTKLYAFYTVLQNRHGASFGSDDMVANEDLKAVSAGIRHSF
ncbi:porin [Comamonas sp. CMM02]|uniref:porin n=1 Tax=Comamonas sp. CMM02 TaxID=2769307 RepID=UPI00177C7BB0|nr:porin [Comamonas sp. CMM02]